MSSEQLASLATTQGSATDRLRVGDDPDAANVELIAEDEETTALRRQSFLRLLEQHALNPPGSDIYNARFYQALALMSADDPTLLDMMIAAQDERSKPEVMRPMTKVSMLNLTQHGINHAMIFGEGMHDFPSRPGLRLHTVQGWRDLLTHQIFPKYSEALMQTYIDRDIQTTDVRRGVVYPLIAHRAFGHREDYRENGIKVLDLGSSANWIWGHLASVDQDQRSQHQGFTGLFTRRSDDPYASVSDLTEDEDLNGLIQQQARLPIPIRSQIAVDRNDPLASQEAILWFLSCRHFGEVSPGALRDTIGQIDRYRRNLSNIEYLNCDYLDLPDSLGKPPSPEEIQANDWRQEDIDREMRQRNLDMITASMTFYILPKELRDKMIADMLDRLNPEDGVLVITDYCSIDDGRLIFTKKRDPYTCKTVVRGPATDDKWLEIAEYESTRAKKVRACGGMRTFLGMPDEPQLEQLMAA